MHTHTHIESRSTNAFLHCRPTPFIHTQRECNRTLIETFSLTKNATQNVNTHSTGSIERPNNSYTLRSILLWNRMLPKCIWVRVHDSFVNFVTIPHTLNWFNFVDNFSRSIVRCFRAIRDRPNRDWKFARSSMRNRYISYGKIRFARIAPRTWCV